ncbi:MAG: nucleotidyltransferase domain-containing protein [Deltaproteobacteria bacterium]|jgi:uncharacterized protein|nr:nucleotidyltransferase domain-containing protein [Deltaproteobacteria bacterium]
MDKRKVLEIVKDYAEVVRENFPVRKIILYGSHARETALADSDIDVAVVLDRVEEDYLSTGAMLFTLSRDIDLRIEPVLLEAGKDMSGFLEEINKTGEIVYSADENEKTAAGVKAN